MTGRDDPLDDAPPAWRFKIEDAGHSMTLTPHPTIDDLQVLALALPGNLNVRGIHRAGDAGEVADVPDG